jgi:hypothetical protein
MFEQPVISDSSRPFGSLNVADLRALQRWVILAREAGIDNVEDLTSRHWPADFSGSVLGVFQPGKPHAAWLAVGQNEHWAIASASDGTVSKPVASLADALALIYRPGDSGGCN